MSATKKNIFSVEKFALKTTEEHFSLFEAPSSPLLSYVIIEKFNMSPSRKFDLDLIYD